MLNLFKLHCFFFHCEKYLHASKTLGHRRTGSHGQKFVTPPNQLPNLNEQNMSRLTGKIVINILKIHSLCPTVARKLDFNLLIIGILYQMELI